MPKAKYAFIIPAAVLIILIVCWYIFASPEFILKLSNEALAKYNCSLAIKDFSHSIPLNIQGNKLSLRYHKKEILSADDIKISFNPFLLSLNFRAKLYGGSFRGSYNLFKGLKFEVKNSELSNFKDEMKGSLNARFDVNGLNFQVGEAKFEDWSGIPFSIFTNAKGSLLIDPAKTNLISVSLAGEAGDALLKGSITKKRIDLTLEFTPKEDSSLWQDKFNGYHMKDGRFIIAVSLPTIIFIH